MKITQLSVFVENAPGHILAPCRALADAGVNIRALSLADAQTFGILRMIVSDWSCGAACREVVLLDAIACTASWMWAEVTSAEPTGGGRVTSCLGASRVSRFSNVGACASRQLKGFLALTPQKSLRTVPTMEQCS